MARPGKKTQRQRFRKGQPHADDPTQDGPRLETKSDDWNDFYVWLTMISTIAVLLVGVYFWVPTYKGKRAMDLVKEKEADFVDNALQTIRSSGLIFHGWDTRIIPPFVLVTFTYEEPGKKGLRAVWWAVDLEEETVRRVKSLADFADNDLLRDGY